MKNALLFGGLTAAALSVACGDDTTGSGGSGGGSTTTTTAATTSSGTTSTTTSTTTAATTTTSTTTTGSGGAAPAEHLLFGEVAVGPEAAEFVEIYNPTAAAIDLSDVYLSDNSTYTSVAAGAAWNPTTNNPGTDFAARFPSGTMIGPEQVLVIGFDPGYEAQYGGCPDLFMGTAPLSCGGAMVPVMLETSAGSVTDASNLSNAREMLVLFTWSGNTADLLQDLDYVTWGATFEDGTRVDKTAVAGYQPDTAAASQIAAAAPAPGESIERCALEVGETLMGGNGASGHDETSEDLAASFQVQATPSPGVKNACLP